MRFGVHARMAGQHFHRPQAIAEVFGHQHFSQHLQAEEGDGARILLANHLGLAQPGPERRQARHGDDVAAAHQLPAVVVIAALDGRRHALEVVAAGHRVIAVAAVPVQGEHGRACFLRLGQRQEQVDRQRRKPLGLEQQVLATMVFQVHGLADHGFPFRRRRVRTEQRAQLGAELGLPLLTRFRRAAAKLHGKRRFLRLLANPFVAGGQARWLFRRGSVGKHRRRGSAGEESPARTIDCWPHAGCLP